MRQKRMRGLWAALLTLCLMAGNACAERMLILSFTGDCTLGSEENRDKLDDSLNSLADAYRSAGLKEQAFRMTLPSGSDTLTGAGISSPVDPKA